jgi:hypothetical protein
MKLSPPTTKTQKPQRYLTLLYRHLGVVDVKLALMTKIFISRQLFSLPGQFSCYLGAFITKYASCRSATNRQSTSNSFDMANGLSAVLRQSHHAEGLVNPKVLALLKGY